MGLLHSKMRFLTRSRSEQEISEIQIEMETLLEKEALSKSVTVIKEKKTVTTKILKDDPIPV